MTYPELVSFFCLFNGKFIRFTWSFDGAWVIWISGIEKRGWVAAVYLRLRSVRAGLRQKTV